MGFICASKKFHHPLTIPSHSLFFAHYWLLLYWICGILTGLNILSWKSTKVEHSARAKSSGTCSGTSREGIQQVIQQDIQLGIQWGIQGESSGIYRPRLDVMLNIFTIKFFLKLSQI